MRNEAVKLDTRVVFSCLAPAAKNAHGEYELFAEFLRQHTCRGLARAGRVMRGAINAVIPANSVAAFRLNQSA